MAGHDQGDEPGEGEGDAGHQNDRGTGRDRQVKHDGQQDAAQGADGQLQPTRNADLLGVLAWQERKLVFSRTPLAQAIAQIQRYRQAPIRLEDPALAQLPISGVFNTDNVEDLLDLLPHILPLTMARDADGTLHITHKPAKK